MNPTPLPTLYISHGSPMTALEPGAAGEAWRALGPAWTRLFGKPRAILALSGHSLTREPVLLAAAHHPTVHDFGGFPQALYDMRYETEGAPWLASRVADLLREAGQPVHRVPDGGLDHGIWVPLRSMFPDADIPVLPLAWPPQWAPGRLHTLGQALAPLTQEGILVMGTGAITHNLRMWAGGRGDIDQPEYPESAAFRQWFEARVAEGDWAALNAYREQAPHAVKMHPTDEHLLPLHLAGGAAGAQARGVRLHASVTWGHLGMDLYAFGEQAARLAEAMAPSSASEPAGA